MTSPMTPTPEPAVGQVWYWPTGTLFEIFSIEWEPPVGSDDAGYPAFHTMGGLTYSLADLADATYLGTLDELRELPALKSDAELWRTQVRTDNSAVIANLEAENAKLRAAIFESLKHWAFERPGTRPEWYERHKSLLTPTPHE